MYEDEDFWPFTCSHCLHEFTEQIGRVKEGAVICPECRTWFTGHYQQFAAALAKARKGQLDHSGNRFTLKKGQ